jgi:hypothetical protein
MEKLVMHMTGIAPMIQHNIRLADPLDEYTKRLKGYTGKRKKTEDDLEEMAHIEFLGSLYYDDEEGVFIPARMVLGSLCKGATGIRGAKALVQGGVLITHHVNPLIYNGPRDPEKLWADKNFRNTSAVRVQAARVMRTRPVFNEWSVQVPLTLDTEVLNMLDFEQITERAGALAGVGDWRPQYGRFSVVLVGGGSK